MLTILIRFVEVSSHSHLLFYVAVTADIPRPPLKFYYSAVAFVNIWRLSFIARYNVLWYTTFYSHAYNVYNDFNFTLTCVTFKRLNYVQTKLLNYLHVNVLKKLPIKQFFVIKINIQYACFFFIWNLHFATIPFEQFN